MVTKSEAIKLFLNAEAPPDLANLYHLGMEVQVNVAPDCGERVEGQYMGRQWHGWSDGVQTWKAFRVPWNAKSNPEYTDSPMVFDLVAHCEGIGMTGWCWTEKKSYWFGYDFDSIVGHSVAHRATLTDSELQEVKDKASAVPWVTVRRSTGGNGLHLYVNVDGVPTKNHTEHAALARAILGKLSLEVGYDFASKIDVCGGNMWVWHRKMRSRAGGLEVLKKGVTLTTIPANWEDHVKVIKGTATRVTPAKIQEVGMSDPFEDLVSSRTTVPLDSKHLELIEYLKAEELPFEWHQDLHMMVTHTSALTKAHEALNLQGVYSTATRGSSEVNCFMFPMRSGVWVVRRYTPGVAESDTWEQDREGWTKCYLNKAPDIRSASRALGGIENEKGQYIFQEAEIASRAASYMGAHFDLPSWALGRKALLQRHKDGRLVVKIERREEDLAIPGWIVEKKHWIRIFNADTDANIEAEVSKYDDTMRHMITESDGDSGWSIKAYEHWVTEPSSNIKLALKSLGIGGSDIDVMMGTAVLRPWRLVNRPFQQEYLGDRIWNKFGAQLSYTPSESDDLKHPHWDIIMSHIGSGLDDAISCDPWAIVSDLRTGADYLRCWVASLFQYPERPLPYLAFWGPQDSGKSILHEGLSLLFNKGYKRADLALTSTGGFNGELEGAVLCVVEETDLTSNKVAYNRLKDWVTSPEIMIQAKTKTPNQTLNTTHWIQTTNDFTSCPAFPGDTRITLGYVKAIENKIPKIELLEKLREEAPDFLASILRLEIPKSNNRLNVPVIATEDKRAVEQLNRTALEIFIEDHTVPCAGNMVLLADFYDRFIESLPPRDVDHWSRIRVGKELPPTFPRGKGYANKVFVGNIAFLNDTVTPATPLKVREGKLVHDVV